MKLKTRTYKVGVGTVEEFMQRSLERARKIDRGERLTPEFRITFEDPLDLLAVITSERVRLMEEIRKKPVGLTELASNLKRNRSAVQRDVKILESSGLVRSWQEPNPGHGRRTVVEAVAKRFELTATF